MWSKYHYQIPEDLRHDDIIITSGTSDVEEMSLYDYGRLSHGSIIIMSDVEEMSQYSRR
jgi:hypothetical protein